VKEVSSRFSVSSHVVYYWIKTGVIPTVRRAYAGSTLWISLDEKSEEQLTRWSKDSVRIQKVKENQNQIGESAV